MSNPTNGANGTNPYPHLFRLMHWLLWPSMIILTLTGLSQHAVASPDWSLLGGILPTWFWAGRVHLIHNLASLVFFPAILAAAWIYLRRRVRLRLTHVVLLLGGVLVSLSGVALLLPVASPEIYWMAKWTHAVTGLAVLPLGFLVHAVDSLVRYRRWLWTAFNPIAGFRILPLLAMVPVAAATTLLVLSGLPAPPSWRDLQVSRIDVKSIETDQLDQLPWGGAQPLSVPLANGIKFPGGQTEVILRALHNGDEIFVLAEWADASEDRQYMPWKKTADGLEELVTDPKDESTYYEDKFSLVFPAEPDWRFARLGCALYCHAGGGPEGTQRYGYKGSDRVVDVWHWKATRTDSCGQVDDKYWAAVDFESKDIGRHGDPKESGGYKKNVSDDKTGPIALADNPASVRQGMIPTEHAVDASPAEVAKIAVDTIIPGIIASPVVGDRGDIACKSQHTGGRWRVYMGCKLDTGHKLPDERPSDAVFEPGGTYHFGCAAFDRSSKRHAYGLTPYRMVLAE